jgi:hypothetical protein
MPSRSKIPARLPSTELKGWQEIAEFLGQPVSVAQRWAKTGIPVARQGRAVTLHLFVILSEVRRQPNAVEGPLHV